MLYNTNVNSYIQLLVKRETSSFYRCLTDYLFYRYLSGYFFIFNRYVEGSFSRHSIDMLQVLFFRHSIDV